MAMPSLLRAGVPHTPHASPQQRLSLPGV